MNYWLMKSEPGTEEGKYSIDQFARDKASAWTGVRNYQARNFMKQMKVGDLAIFYHSNAEPSGAAGIMRIKAAAHTDETALNSKSKYFDPKSTREKPIWECVDVAFVEKFKEVVALADIRANKKLAKMMVLQKGSRLSVQPVTEADFLEICRMAQAKFKG